MFIFVTNQIILYILLQYYQLTDILKTGLKIAICALCLFGSKVSTGQSEGTLLPMSNKLLLNPSFAGLSGSSDMWTGVQFFSNSGQEANHLFSLTYDHYSEKLKGGVGWFFYQGIDGKNNSGFTGAGLAYAKSVYTSDAGNLIASANLNSFIYTKQLYGYTSERLATDSDDYKQINTDPFRKYNELLPRIGLVWSSSTIQTGISFSNPVRFFNGQKPTHDEYSDYISVFSISKKFEGIQQGLLSKPYMTEPEIVILLSDRQFVIRTGIKLEHTKNNFGLFLLNNISDEMHGLTGLIGWNIKNIKINFSGGCLYSLPLQTFSFNGEAFIGVVIPEIHFNEDKPWRPSEKLF